MLPNTLHFLPYPLTYTPENSPDSPENPPEKVLKYLILNGKTTLKGFKEIKGFKFFKPVFGNLKKRKVKFLGKNIAAELQKLPKSVEP